MTGVRPDVAGEDASTTGGFDIARVAAAIAIVGYHSMWFSAYLPVRQGFCTLVLQGWLYAALPFFFVLSGLLDGSRTASGVEWPRRRINRLLFLYVAWSSLYLAFRAVTGTMDKALRAGAWGIVLLGMAADHLWFLVALAECIILMWMLRRAGTSAAAVLIAAAALSAAYVILNSLRMLSSQSVLILYRTLIPWFSYYALGSWFGENPSATLRLAQPRWLLPLLGAFAALGVLYRIPEAADFRFAAFIISVSAIAVATVLLLLRTRVERSRTHGLAGLALGIYVMHPMAVSALEIPWKRFGLQTPALVRGIAVWAAATIVCVAVVLTLRKTRLRILVS